MSGRGRGKEEGTMFSFNFLLQPQSSVFHHRGGGGGGGGYADTIAFMARCSEVFNTDKTLMGSKAMIGGSE